MFMKCKVLKVFFRLSLAAVLPIMSLSCEIVDHELGSEDEAGGACHVGLDQIALVMSEIPLEQEHLNEVHCAVSSSSGNGYDEEYTMSDLFLVPGKGVGDGDSDTRGLSSKFVNPLRNLIERHVRSSMQTRASAGGISDPDEFLDALIRSDIQIYWPFSESWDGRSMPVITFDPEDGADANIGYRLIVNDDGTRHVEEVIVDEQMAKEVPVWVMNRNSDAGYTSLELLRREDPDWGTGGGTIIVRPETKTTEVQGKSLILKDFTMNRNYDTWFAGASEFFVKVGAVDDFMAATEAEMKLYNPLVTDFMIVVKRSQVGQSQPFNAVLISDWNPQMTHCALMITEDDGGTITEWKCTALVRIASKSYGVEINLPFNSRDDIAWRGQLASRWIEANSNVLGHFGDLSLTFEVVEY